MIDKRKIVDDVESMVNVAESSNTGASMLICEADYPEYEKVLIKRGYQPKKNSFGLMTLIEIASPHV